MTNSTRIADKLIALSLISNSRGILTLPGKPAADTVNVTVETHIMPIAAYNERFGAKGGGK